MKMKENLTCLRISLRRRAPNLILVFARIFNPKIMQKKTFLAAFTALTLAAVFVPTTFAFSGFGGQGKNFNPENKEAIESAIEAEDYDAFVEATGKSNLTEENFTKILERHSEMETRRAEMEADREAIQDAIENGDYEEWKSLIEEKNPNNPLLEIITEDNFSKLQELHGLREEIKVIQEDLGIEKDFKGGFGGKKFGPRNFRN